jgi:hypothetical protein
LTELQIDIPKKVNESDLGEIPLTNEQRERIIFRKYESTNKMVTDMIHEGDWHIQVTADARLGLGEEDGVIIDFIGRPISLVAMTNRGEILNEDEAELREEASGGNLPRYRQFGFRIHKLTKTDGPEGRRMLSLSQDQKRKEGENNLVDSIASAFAQATSSLNNQGQMNPHITDIVDTVKANNRTTNKKK